VSATRGTVLVIEDDADVREVLADVLRAHGYTVVTAGDGEDGLRAARGAPPGLILLDLMMPRMSGYEFLEVRATDRELRAIPVIVLTADRSANDRLSDGGAALVLSKPPALDQLLDSVTALCRDRAATG
jgi:CheY-like chemotaxis protein